MSAVPQIAQIALCTRDIVASVARYEALGFAQAGGGLFHGQHLADLQELDGDPRCVVWWLVGRQDFVQLELFQHTNPAPRPLPADWRPSDLGWVRCALAVPDLSVALARVGVAPLAPPSDGRAAYRDPDFGIVVELIEAARAPGGDLPRFYDLAPFVVSATLSVADLSVARAFWIDTVGLVEEPLAVLHEPHHEAVWGLDGARRSGFVARGGDVRLEVVRYEDPRGRPPDPDRRLSDEGCMNVAVGFRERERLEALHARVVTGGYQLNAPLPPPPAGATYGRDGEGHSFEIIAVPREFDPTYGFQPAQAFQVAPRWPSS